jgi:hypothetical protein
MNTQEELKEALKELDEGTFLEKTHPKSIVVIKRFDKRMSNNYYCTTSKLGMEDEI